MSNKDRYTSPSNLIEYSLITQFLVQNRTLFELWSKVQASSNIHMQFSIIIVAEIIDY